LARPQPNQANGVALETIRQSWEWSLLEGGCIESAYCRASPRSHDDGPREVATRPPGDDLGGPRRVVEADRADPQGVLAPQGLGATAGELEAGPQRDHLPDAERLPVGPAARAIRPQEHRP